MRYRALFGHCCPKYVTAALVVLGSLLWAIPVPAREKAEIAMVLYRGQTASEKGFMEALQKSREFEVHFSIFDCSGDAKKLDRIVADLVPSKYRLIYVFGTTVAQKMMKKTKEVPIVFNIVQRPVEGGIVRGWNNSGNNCTGASNFVPMDVVLRTLRLVKNIQTLGVMYYEKEPNSLYQKEDIYAQQPRFGFNVIDLPIRSKETIPETFLTMLEKKPDVVIFPSDSFVKANADRIISTLNKHKIPSIVIIPEMARENNALLALGPDYYTLGRLAAENALQILKGKKPSDLPVRTVDRLKIVINMRTADRLGIIFPIQLLMFSEIVR